jgi:multidrug efflux system outer membrane protein
MAGACRVQGYRNCTSCTHAVFLAHGGLGVVAPGESFFSIGGNFLASVIDGGRMQALVQIATAEQEAALVAYGQTALRAYRDVEDSLDAERALAQRAAQVTIQLHELHELHQAEPLRSVEVEVGKADTLSVLQLQAQAYATESLLLALQQAQRSQRVNRHLALGGGFE